MLGAGSFGLATATGVRAASTTTAAGRVVFVYDDSSTEDYTETFPVHQEMNAPGCIAANPGRFEEDRSLTESQLREMADAGWEVLSHTSEHRPVGDYELVREAAAGDTRVFPVVNNHGKNPGDRIRISDGVHSEVVTVAGYGSVDSRDYEDEYITLANPLESAFGTDARVRFTDEILHAALADSKAQLEAMGFTVTNFVYPYGNKSERAREWIPSYYDAVANGQWDSGLNAIDGLDPYRLHRRYFRSSSMTESELETYFDRLVHEDILGILAGHSERTDFTPERVRLALEMADERDVEVVTLREALTRLDGVDLGSRDAGTTDALSTDQPEASQWHRTRFPRNRDDPVVVAGPVSEGSEDPVHARVRGVAGWGFDFRFEEWSYLDGSAPTQRVDYLAAASGRDALDDGTHIEAGRVTTDETFVPVSFEEAFDATPVVLTQSQTCDDPEPVVTRLRDVSAAGMEVCLQEEEAAGDHAEETVGFVAFEPGTGAIGRDRFETGRTEDAVVDEWYRIDFQRTYTDPRFVASIQTYDGPNTAGVRYRNLSGDGVEVQIEEEQSADAETGHISERVGYFVAGTDTPRGETGSLSTDQPDRETWHTAALAREYDDPVVIAGPPSYEGWHEMHPRVRRVTGSDFEFQLEEWLYLDGSHWTEHLDYLALEMGAYQTGETRVEVGRVETDETFASIFFEQAFAATPVVFTQSQTHNGWHPIVTRPRDVSTTGMAVRLQEEEAEGPHSEEAVGYAAFESGAGTLGGAPFEVHRTGDLVTEEWYRIDFQRTYTDPQFVASIQTYDGPNTVELRYRNLAGNGVEVRLEEEQSADEETSHFTERVGYLVSEGAPAE
jgi:peptidoglycan/xylan/chitin deacetylase (PgdA/CDA1 family)